MGQGAGDPSDPSDSPSSKARSHECRRARGTSKGLPEATLPMKSYHALCHGLLLLSGLAAPVSAAEPPPAIPIPAAAEILSRLKKEHPRLLASAKDFATLKEQVAREGVLKDWTAKVRESGQRMLTQPASKYEIPDGLRLLSTSRRVLQRVRTLSLLYRLEGDRRYLDRAWLELQTAAGFTNWNPRHFLDTAEMTHAFALGYDWLYDQWTPEQRTVLREAMLEKGIRLATELHRKKQGWTRVRHNWNQVCNGGIGMGALALADEAPELCGEFLQAALKSIQGPMAEFNPDGAWAEGPGYWGYATDYNVVFLAALESALGTDFGLGGIPGFAEAGMFPLYASGPRNTSFDYADAHEGVIRAPQMFWLARRFDRPAFARFARRNAAGDPLSLLWYDRRGEAPAAAPLPLDKYFRHAEVVTLRSAWEDPNALFVGFKAGDNKANHSHLDLGSFILEALGTRWAMDLGADDYNMPAYFGNQRWSYYRLRAEGHNTLLINPGRGADQTPSAVAPITRFVSQPGKSFAVADLTAAYAGQARSVQRGLALLDRSQVLVQDEIQPVQPSEVWWFLHTGAKPAVAEDGRSAVLTQGENRLLARLLSPAGAGFTVREARPLPSSPDPTMQARNQRVSKLAIQLKEAGATRLAVLLTPLRPGEKAPAVPQELPPLAQW